LLQRSCEAARKVIKATKIPRNVAAFGKLEQAYHTANRA